MALYFYDKCKDHFNVTEKIQEAKEKQNKVGELISLMGRALLNPYHFLKSYDPSKAKNGLRSVSGHEYFEIYNKSQRMKINTKKWNEIMNPNELSNKCYKAKAYQSENRHNEALKCFNNALELKPKIEQKKLLLITKAEIFSDLPRQIRLGKC